MPVGIFYLKNNKAVILSPFKGRIHARKYLE